MQRPDRARYEALLLRWGFVETTDWSGAAKAEAAFSEVVQTSTPIYVHAVDMEDGGMRVTFVFDPCSGRLWSREGHIMMETSSLPFEDVTMEAVYSEQQKRSRS